ncbi:vacuolar ABC heavy metal transporter [Penicillium daleae]|uniref:Vacuolar ABC heavy metal transporter n=1 Tax=Penicillium daleae TaxID=63821 RepID=A0AAD6CDN1_9EURO|nr:vacuolar ABC heavy metal transporter [Penicillium daleae]KAJ5460916.1 vacuolar ABC heavy metal transporter [Penicillium daleae]
MIEASTEENAMKTESLMSYETVKYFNAEKFEFKRYCMRVQEVRNANYRNARFAGLMNTCQNTFMMAGAPVVDSPTARPLVLCRGDITFKNVTFSYDERRLALNRLLLNCRAGTTTAFVGCITVDGHDVRNITIDSLRKHIGVVAQHPVLFNNSLMYNLKYANQNATDEQVYDACRAASVHGTIMSFPEGYSTKVGDRGLRLSGEKQRVAIAGVILKDPKIILLDEATAYLDTNTEENIQRSLEVL